MTRNSLTYNSGVLALAADRFELFRDGMIEAGSDIVGARYLFLMAPPLLSLEPIGSRRIWSQ